MIKASRKTFIPIRSLVLSVLRSKTYRRMRLIPKIGIVITSCVCISFVGCGRKQKSVFSFSDKPDVKINKLQFSSVRGIQVVKNAQGNRITWLPVNNAIGYNVYRLARRLIVAKKPANKEIIQTTSFVDITAYNACGYFVRPVFMHDEKKIEGPASQIKYLD